jgi:hypothetical protein
MTRSSPGVAEKRGGLPGIAGRLPPEERFWKRYSPHHEFPLSSATSAALHVLVLALLLAIAWVAVKLGAGEESRPIPVTAVYVGGGDGREKGGPGPGSGGETSLPEDRATNPEAGKPAAGVELPDLNPGQAAPPPPTFTDKNGRPMPAAAGKALKALDALERDAQDKLMRGLGDSKDKGGPGAGGGDRPGLGPNKGPGDGPGTGKLTRRQQRQLRWHMTFTTQSGEDYLRQLGGIRPGSGAILAVPVGEKRYRVLRDLGQRPATGEVEDLARLKQICWVDDRPESVAGLARALGIPTPPAFIALFPPKLEEHLADLEKARLEQDFPGRTEDDIDETHFVVVPSAEGYEARLVSVSVKR